MQEYREKFSQKSKDFRRIYRKNPSRNSWRILWKIFSRNRWNQPKCGKHLAGVIFLLKIEPLDKSIKRFLCKNHMAISGIMFNGVALTIFFNAFGGFLHMKFIIKFLKKKTGKKYFEDILNGFPAKFAQVFVRQFIEISLEKLI